MTHKGRKLRPTWGRLASSGRDTSTPLTVRLEGEMEDASQPVQTLPHFFSPLSFPSFFLPSLLPFFSPFLSFLSPSSPPEQETKVAADMVDYQKVCQLIRSPLSDMVTPAHAGELCLWGDEGTYDHVEIEYGQQIRLKTRGNSPFIGNQLLIFCCCGANPLY